MGTLECLLFVFLSLIFIKLVKGFKKPASNLKIPPGPMKLPIIGNILDLLTPTPHRKLRDLSKKYGPLMQLQLGEIPTVVVSSPEYAKEFTKTHDVIFASRPRLQSAEVVTYECQTVSYAPVGDFWREARKICTMEILSPKRVQSNWPIREQEVGNLVKRIASQEGSLVNLTEGVVSLVFTIMSKLAFGKEYKGQDEFISAVKEQVKMLGGFDLVEYFPTTTWLQYVTGRSSVIKEAHGKVVDKMMENIINEKSVARSRRTKEGLVGGAAEEDNYLVDVLLKIEDSTKGQDFQLKSDGTKGILLDIFTAGNETSTTIDWAMAEMIKNPRVLKKAQAEVREVFDRRGRIDEAVIDELKYLKVVIKELLRLHPPFPLLMPRESSQDCEINGYHIPAKTRVVINAWAIATDPKYWNEPDKFYPERFLDRSVEYKGPILEYLPFGAGRRSCPGINLALAILEVSLSMLLYHFDWKLPNGMKNEDLDMTEEYGVSVERKNDLYLIPVVSRSLLVT